MSAERPVPTINRAFYEQLYPALSAEVETDGLAEGILRGAAMHAHTNAALKIDAVLSDILEEASGKCQPGEALTFTFSGECDASINSTVQPPRLSVGVGFGAECAGETVMNGRVVVQFTRQEDGFRLTGATYERHAMLK